MDASDFSKVKPNFRFDLWRVKLLFELTKLFLSSGFQICFLNLQFNLDTIIVIFWLVRILGTIQFFKINLPFQSNTIRPFWIISEIRSSGFISSEVEILTKMLVEFKIPFLTGLIQILKNSQSEKSFQILNFFAGELSTSIGIRDLLALFSCLAIEHCVVQPLYVLDAYQHLNFLLNRLNALVCLSIDYEANQLLYYVIPCKECENQV